MESNIVNSKRLVVEEYFKSNEIIVSKFFEEQRKMFEMQQDNILEADRTKIFLHLMKLNEDIVQSAFDAQKYGLSYLLEDKQNIGSNELLTTIKDEHSLESQGVEIREEIKKPEQEDIQSSRFGLENWLKTEISKITGFPYDRISGTMKFEEDLGLVSIDMVEMFSHLMEEFPDLNRDVNDLIAATSVDELLDIMALEEKLEMVNREILEKWLINELSKITGFPSERISGAMKFEEDLGLVSIDMVELFYKLSEKFPELNKDLNDIIGVASIDEFLDIMLQDDSKGKDELHIDGTDDLGEKENNENNDASKLISELKKTISNISNVPLDKITLEEDFDNLNINIFSLEDIYDELLSKYNNYNLFKQEILNAANLEQVEKLLSYFIPTFIEQKKENIIASETDCLAEINRYAFNYEKMDASADYSLPKNILVVGIKNEMFHYFTRQFKQSEINVIEVNITETGWKTEQMGSETIGFDDVTKFQEYLKSYLDDSGNLPSLVFLATDSKDVLEGAKYSEWNVKIDQSAVALFAITSIYNQAKESKTIKNFVSVIGQSNSCPISSTTRGLARTLAHDLKNKYHVRSIWLEEDYKLIPIKSIYYALSQGSSNHDIFINSNDIKVRTLCFPRFEGAAKKTVEINPSSVIVVFGGGAGITSEVACAMAAKYQCKIIVVGRTVFSTECIYEDIKDDAALKQKIFNELSMQLKGVEYVTKDVLEKETKRVYRQRSILDTKRRIEKAGSQFFYYSCDIAKYSDLNNLLKTIHETHGKITGIIHGAGEVNSQRNKTIDSFRRNLYIKTSSFFTLYHFFKDYPLKFAIFFSSISAYAGIPKLYDYSASNEFVNEFTSYWNNQVDYPALSIMWSLWTETGIMKNSTQDVVKLGLKGISNKQGIDLFLRELEYIDKSLDCVLLTHDTMLDFSMP